MPTDPNGQTQEVEEIQPEVVSTSNETPEESELPEDVSERTKEQFDKLTEHNRQLKEENERLKAQKEQISETSALDVIKMPGEIAQEQPELTPPPATNFPGLTQKQVDDTFSNLVDKDGYVDLGILKNTLVDLQKRVKAAEEKNANLQKSYEEREEGKQVRETHKKYPQLDPKSPQFDPKFFEKVKKELIVQFVNGKKDFMAAADAVAEDYPLKQNSKVEDTKVKEDQVRQINAIGSSISRSASKANNSSDSDDDLIRRTRAGDSSALAERLKRAGL